jgi:hypothetical protein
VVEFQRRLVSGRTLALVSIQSWRFSKATHYAVAARLIQPFKRLLPGLQTAISTKLHPERPVRRLVQRLERLGLSVELASSQQLNPRFRET